MAEEEKMLRVIRYKFGADFLDHKQIGTRLAAGGVVGLLNGF